MNYIADLHIHSPYSRATSKLSHLHGLAAWAAIKGIQVVGTGDFTHPGWLNHIQEHLEEAEPGFFRLKDTSRDFYSSVIPEGLIPDISGIRFVLTSEISSIYKRSDRVRKIHNILFAPDLDAVRRINVSLSAIGNLESDGRPILGLDSRDLLEILLENAPDGFLVPAHIWTPWFSLFGSKSGFDRIEECFGDLTSHIFALETGLSSDPDMNRTISALDRFTLISNSDCHSPAKLGREANQFSTGFDFFSLREALKQPVDKEGRQRFTGTIEFYPEEGKYHCDGHRKCKVCMEPRETRRHNGICPECGKPVTVGVLYRIMELADRTEPVYPEGAPAVYSLVPLSELLGELLQVGPASKKVMQNYVRLIQQFGSEFAILLHADIADIEQHSSSHLAEAVHRVRSGKVIRKPGYDGEFGVIRVFSENERKNMGGQKSLFTTQDKVTPRKTSRRVTKIKPAKRVSQQQSLVSKTLNPEQQEIVNSDARHILVKAGPGTGKTHTLIQRVVRIMKTSQEKPCTVITFTNKAAKELTKRIHSILGDTHTAHVSTMHGFCLQWLRKNNAGIKVVSPETRRRYLRQLSQKEEKGRVDELDRKLSTFLHQATNLSQPVPAALQPYFDRLQTENLIDMDEVIPAFIALLQEKDEIAGEIRKATGYLFIDEFQDLNASQYAMVRLLAESSPVFAIGDPDQAIYGFRGSSPTWFYRFGEELKPHIYTLFRNYRSTEKIVAAANKVIAHNHDPGSVIENRAESQTEGRIFLQIATTPRQEAQFIVRQIEMLVGGTSHREIDRLQDVAEIDSVTMNDIAVLYRTTRQADIVASTLLEHGFPVQVVDIVPYYLTLPIRPLYYALLLLADRAEVDHALTLLSDMGVSKKDLQQVEEELSPGQNNIMDILLEHDYPWSGKVADRVVLLRNLREKGTSLAAGEDIRSIMGSLAQSFNISDDEPDLERFLRMAGNYGSNLNDFANHLIHYNDSVVYDERADSVALMTLHAAKGLEFKVIFIIGLEEGILPLTYKGDGTGDVEQRHLEEERRLFYVGMTRAEQIVYLSHTMKRGRNGHDQLPSRFVDEIPTDCLTTIENKGNRVRTGKKVQQLRLFDEI